MAYHIEPRKPGSVYKQLERHKLDHTHDGKVCRHVEQ